MTNAENEERLRAVLGVTLMLVLYGLTRGPFYLQPLMGEEGIFANLLARSPAGPAYGLLGRVHGQEVYDPLRHPALLYEAYTRWGALLRALARILGRGAAAPSDLWARMAHSAFQAALWARLAWDLNQARGRSLILLSLVAALGLSSPLGVSASIYLQTDTSTGLLLAGLVALALAEGRSLRATALAFFALGAVGKQEWTVAALAGVGAGEILARIQGLPRAGARRRLVILISALAVGNLASLALDPLNYLGGLNVLSGVSAGHQALAGGQARTWAELWPVRRIFVLSLLALLFPATALAWTAPIERRTRELSAVALAWAFFLPFLASTWNSSPRYFAPAWGAALACLASQAAGRRPSARTLALAIGAAAFVCAWQIHFLGTMLAGGRSLTEFPFYPVAGVVQRQQAVVDASPRGCVPRLSSAYAWSRPLDFAGDAMDGPSSNALVLSHGGIPCP